MKNYKYKIKFPLLRYSGDYIYFEYYVLTNKCIYIILRNYSEFMGYFRLANEKLNDWWKKEDIQ